MPQQKFNLLKNKRPPESMAAISKEGAGSIQETAPQGGNLKVGRLVKDIEKPVERRSYNLKFIPRHKIRPNEKNDYPQENIEELADNILHFGLIHNLEGLYEEEEDCYVLESGERRYRALSLLLDRYSNFGNPEDEEYKLYQEHVKEFEGGFPLNVKRRRHAEGVSELDDIDSELRLIAANKEVRPDNPDVRLRNIRRYDELLRRKNGLMNHEDRVNINKEIAAKEGISERQVQKYKNIGKLIPELQEEFKNSNITLNEGANYAQLTEAEQQIILGLIQEGKKVSAKEVKRLKELAAAREKELENLKKEQEEKAAAIAEMEKKISDAEAEKEKALQLIRAEMEAELNKPSPDGEKVKELSVSLQIAHEEQAAEHTKRVNTERELEEKKKRLKSLEKELRAAQGKPAALEAEEVERVRSQVRMDSLVSNAEVALLALLKALNGEIRPDMDKLMDLMDDIRNKLNNG